MKIRIKEEVKKAVNKRAFILISNTPYILNSYVYLRFFVSYDCFSDVYPIGNTSKRGFWYFFIRAEGFNTPLLGAVKKVLNPECNTT
jgi:hypothetical protein